MELDELNRLERLQAAADAIDRAGETPPAVDAALILFLLRAIRTARQRITALEERVSTLEGS